MPRSLSRRAQVLRASPIRTMSVECARVGGINLAQGVCDTPVPPAVRQAAQAAIEAGANVYSRAEGVDALRQQLAAKLRRHNGLDYDWESELVVTSGATGAFYVAALALLEPGDEVILLEPYYGYHANTLHAVDAVPRYVALEPPDWRLPLDALEAAVNERTRGIVINTPANPSGKVFTRAELETVRDFACAHDLLVFSDEVYQHFVFDGREHVSPAALEGMRERCIMLSALSKTFAITGWRIGWLAADRRYCPAFAALSDLVYVCAPTPLQVGCARALELLDESYYAGMAAEYQAKRDTLCDALASGGLTPHVPEGSYYALADLSKLPGEGALDRALHLLRERGVACVPGTAFYHGEIGQGLGRFCFGKTDADLAEACRRLRRPF